MKKLGHSSSERSAKMPATPATKRSVFAGFLALAALLVVPAAVGHANAPAGRYVDNTPGTVSDTKTGLTWQQGFTDATYTWAAAQTYCHTLPLAGGGWRVPNIKELQTLVDESTVNPAIDVSAQGFPGTPADLFWSSSPYAGYPLYAWAVAFADGSNSVDATTDLSRVRCVR